MFALITSIIGRSIITCFFLIIVKKNYIKNDYEYNALGKKGKGKMYIIKMKGSVAPVFNLTSLLCLGIFA
jgi:hypothetical protein